MAEGLVSHLRRLDLILWLQQHWVLLGDLVR